MVDIVTRAGKGSPLTNAEADANVVNLNEGKAERPLGTKALTVASPFAPDSVTVFYASGQIVLSAVRAVVSGSAPSVTYSVRSAASRSDPSPLSHVSSAVVTSQTSGDSAALAQAAVPAGSWVWVELESLSGQVSSFSVALDF